VEAIRLLRVARRSAVKARTQAANQLHAVVDTAPAELRQRLGSVNTEQLVAVTARFHRCHPGTPAEAARLALRTLARRWEVLDDEITMLDAHLDELTESAAPTLRAINGVGPQNAAALLAAAGDNPDRLRSTASFAARCGTSPIDASSGRQQRHRLNRGGDRQANCAIYTIVMCRLRWHPPTKDDMARRLAEGRTTKEVIRCLKRYVAREVHRAITTDLGTPTATRSSRITA
ncbi:MAG: transposase, partial [Actinomycetota bacterium]|nr:transposase [Actinomycetota bacterium]